MSDVKIGLIGGTGLGDALGGEKGRPIDIVTPFGRPSSSIVCCDWQGVEVCILQRHGPGHIHNPTAVPYRANLFALKSLGVTHIVASGATGSLREHIHPGELVIADQIIDKTHRRAGTFFDKAAVHVEFAEPFCPVMRRWLIEAACRLSAEHPQLKVHDRGCYVCMEGPAFSTRAESHLHRGLGGDLIGMTAMPEARLAREAEIAYALIALPTDYDCWRPHADLENGSGGGAAKPAHDLLAEIIGNLNKATAAGIALIKAALTDVSILRQQRSPAHEALKLAIWSDRKRIDPDEVKRLGVLWGRYFETPSPVP